VRLSWLASCSMSQATISRSFFLRNPQPSDYSLPSLPPPPPPPPPPQGGVRLTSCWASTSPRAPACHAGASALSARSPVAVGLVLVMSLPSTDPPRQLQMLLGEMPPPVLLQCRICLVVIARHSQAPSSLIPRDTPSRRLIARVDSAAAGVRSRPPT